MSEVYPGPHPKKRIRPSRAKVRPLKSCEWCGSVFPPASVKARFCSKACRQAEYAHAHPGYFSEAQRRYMAKSDERKAARKAYMAEYRQTYVEPEASRVKRLAKARQRFTDNPDLLIAQRAQRLGYVVGHTHVEWLAKVQEYESCCAYCLARLRKPAKDHVIPISIGDPATVDAISNIVPSCKSCNSAKNVALWQPFRWID